MVVCFALFACITSCLAPEGFVCPHFWASWALRYFLVVFSFGLFSLYTSNPALGGMFFYLLSKRFMGLDSLKPLRQAPMVIEDLAAGARVRAFSFFLPLCSAARSNKRRFQSLAGKVGLRFLRCIKDLLVILYTVVKRPQRPMEAQFDRTDLR